MILTSTQREIDIGKSKLFFFELQKYNNMATGQIKAAVLAIHKHSF